MVWYLAKRRLGFEIDEWEALPWWKQMVYLEGLSEEFYDPEQDDLQEQDYTDDWSSLAGAMGAQYQQVVTE